MRTVIDRNAPAQPMPAGVEDPAGTTRRRFMVLAAAAGAGLTLGLPVGAADPAAEGTAGAAGEGAAVAAGGDKPQGPFRTYLHIEPDNTVTVLSAHLEMGQGCHLGVTTLVAEELDADPAQLGAIGAAGDPKHYGNLAWGGKIQGTGGSTAMASSFERYRRAGATARAMLVAAAAQEWGVPAAEIRVAKGVLSHQSGRSATLGEMADAAARLTPPAEVTLKPRSTWTLIGEDGLRRFDSAPKARGEQGYTIDVGMPQALVAVVAHPPRFGARLASFDAARAKQVAGVTDVVPISRGVAVIAETTWAALQGREALGLTWDESAAETRGSAELLAEYQALAQRPGERLAAERGDAERALGRAATVIEATYVFPFLAHAALEPLDAVVAGNAEAMLVVGGHQLPDLYQQVVARLTGLPSERVRMSVLPVGGSFGRRAVADADVVVDAVEAAKAIEYRAPVKLLWTREDEMRAGRFRPMYVHRVRLGVDAEGRIAGWRQHIVGQSILAGTPFEAMLVKDGIDKTSVEGCSDMAYAVADLRVELTSPRIGVPVLWWRSVGHTHTAYVVETMIDAAAAAARVDPVAFRRALLPPGSRERAVLDLAAAKAGWGTPLPAGRFRGVAVHTSFDTAVAQVAEISVVDAGTGGGAAGAAPAFRVERVVCAVDCGTVINPDQVRAQMEGGIGMGLGAILHEEVTLRQGRVEQVNYDSYRVLRIDEMPRVEVHVVPSEAAPTGVGEPGVPPIGPAVANAYAAATGRRVRILPFDRGLRAV